METKQEQKKSSFYQLLLAGIMAGIAEVTINHPCYYNYFHGEWESSTSILKYTRDLSKHDVFIPQYYWLNQPTTI